MGQGGGARRQEEVGQNSRAERGEGRCNERRVKGGGQSEVKSRWGGATSGVSQKEAAVHGGARWWSKMTEGQKKHSIGQHGWLVYTPLENFYESLHDIFVQSCVPLA